MAAEIKRIGIFIPSLEGGGVQRAMLNLAKSLVTRGYGVDLVLVKARGPFLNKIPKGVRLVDLGASRALFSLPKFVSYLQKNTPDAIISSQTHINAAAILAVWISRVKTRLMVTEQEDLLVAVKKHQNFKEKFRPLIVRWLYPFADCVVGISRGVANDIAIITQGKLKHIHMINNPYDLEDIQNKTETFVDHPWFSQEKIPIIVAVGRLVQQKDYATLLKAFAILRSRMPAHLVILGEGVERAKIENLITSLGISEDVSMPGFVENPFAFMAQANLFVLSSAWEGFANVLVEAMACGTPVVSTDCPSGPAEILDGGKYGRLVPVGDPEALAEALFQEYNDPHDSQMLKQRATDFSIERILPQYLEVLLPDEGNPA